MPKQTGSGINTAFTRESLRLIHVDVRKHIQGVRLREAWVYKVGKDHWEFHYNDASGAFLQPNGARVEGHPNYYWHGGADDAYDARTKGWSAYLTKLEVEGYK